MKNQRCSLVIKLGILLLLVAERRAEPLQKRALRQQLDCNTPLSSSSTSKDQTIVQTVDHIADNKDEYKVVCYFTNWAWYRPGKGKYTPDNIDPKLCTHIIYGFAVLDGTTLTIKTHDSWADIDNKFYERVVAYKKQGIKVLMAIGGWTDSAGDKYSRLVGSATSRTKFIRHVVQFIEKHKFDGLDLDWEYPVCWQVDCSKGPASDKKSFSLFVKELSETFKPKGLLLSTAVSPSKRVIDAGYDVPNLSKYFDWIAVMAYDYHGDWDKKTGHVAPLYRHDGDWERTFNSNFSIQYWIDQGAAPKKLVMGAPFYGKSFTLANKQQHGLNAPTNNGGTAGEITRASGTLAYYEICDRTLKKGWTVVQDPEKSMGPYAYKGDQWVSFDDAEQIKRKSEYIKEMGLGGGMVWALDFDDFNNACNCEPYPLLRTMNRVLRNYPDGPNCSVTDNAGTNTMHEITTPEPTYVPSTDTEAGSPQPAEPSFELCEGGTFRPHENDCSKYNVCDNGKWQEMDCAKSLHWNEKVETCDWQNAAKCDEGINEV